MEGQVANTLQKIRQEEVVEASNMVFSSMVTRNYLSELETCEVLPYNDDIQLSGVKWFRIDKIVKEKNVFFTDKLSMLYMSLHKQAKNVILVLNKQNDSEIELYLGARDFAGSLRISSEILESGLQGYFPGIGFTKKNQLPEMIFSKPSVASVSAIASLRDDKKEDFVQGIERLINATYSLPKFRAYFIAENVKNEDCEMMIKSFADLYTGLSPAETLQMTYNESESKGVSESFTKNFSKTIGESISKTVSHSEGSSENITHGDSKTTSTSTNYSSNILDNIVTSIFGGETGTSENTSVSENYSKSIGKNFTDSTSTQTGKSSSVQEGTSEQTGTSKNETRGYSKQITYKNRTAKYYLDILDKQIERLQKGEPFGLWSVATYFVANDMTSTLQLANIYRGSIIGEESGLESCSINSWTFENPSSREICKYLDHNTHPHFNYKSLDVTAGSVVTSQELAIHLSLPQDSVPGLIVEERATFARNVSSLIGSDNTIELGKVLHLGRVYETDIKLDIDELSKHTLVTGSTGSGKSNTMYGILSSLKEMKVDDKICNITFLVIEPAKGEYKNVFGHDDDVTVYSTTPRFGKLLRINPFEFPWESIDVFEHIDRLVDIFNACWPMYAAMPSVLKHSIVNAYKKCGWDLILTQNKFEYNGKPIFPTVEDVLVCLKEYINSSEYSDEAKGDYKGALETRLLDLNSGLMGLIFSGDTIPDEDLFDKNAIIDLSRVSALDKAMFMGLVILKLNEYRMSKGGMNQKLKHVTVLEEAHNLLKRTSQEQGQESSNLVGKSVEMITNSIAEMRTYGEGFIIVDQSPSLLDAAAIRNTNTKIVMSLPEYEDREIAGKSMSLTDEQIDQIAKQGVGEAIVYQNSWESAVQCKINKTNRNMGQNYTVKYDTPDAPCRQFRKCIVNFILQPYTQKQMDVAEIRKYLTKDIMPSSVRVELLTLLDEYNNKGTISLWKESKFSKLSQVVANYLDLDKEVTNLKQLIVGVNGIERFRYSFDELLKERFDENLDTEFIFYIQQGYIQKLRPEYYEGWKNTYKIS